MSTRSLLQMLRRVVEDIDETTFGTVIEVVGHVCVKVVDAVAGHERFVLSHHSQGVRPCNVLQKRCSE